MRVSAKADAKSMSAALIAEILDVIRGAAQTLVDKENLLKMAELMPFILELEISVSDLKLYRNIGISAHVDAARQQQLSVFSYTQASHTKSAGV